jgi:uncharacterized membrane protein
MLVATPHTGQRSMATQVLTWLVAIPLLGTVTGLRTLTPIAVLCWFAFLGHLDVDGTWASWTAKLSTAVIFTVLAVAELVADKLPKTPNRTSPGPLAARLIFGGLVGAIVATGIDGPGIEGVFLGVAGALVGAFGGFLVRREFVQRTNCKDWNVALAEDAIAISCAILALGVITG